MEAAGASVKVFELMDRQPNISNEDGQVRPADLKGHIEFKNVTFGYPSREDSVILKVLGSIQFPGPFCVEPLIYSCSIMCEILKTATHSVGVKLD